MPWTLFFNGLGCTHGCGIGLVIISHRAQALSLPLQSSRIIPTIKQKYDDVFRGLQLLKEVEADKIEIIGDSLLVIN